VSFLNTIAEPKTKGVHFPDTYSLIGADDDQDEEVDGNNNGEQWETPPAHHEQTYATMPRGTGAAVLHRSSLSSGLS